MLAINLTLHSRTNSLQTAFQTHTMPATVRKPLKSSKLRAAGYDERSRVMEIEFVNGDVYEYKAVSPELYRQLMSSPSPNSFFEDKIEENFPGKRTGKVAKSGAADAFDDLFGARSNDG